jgi:predicted permease
MIFGLAPALRSTRVDLISALKDVRTGESSERLRRGWRRVSLGQALVVGQIAASLLLLVTAGLFVRTLSNLESIQLGFNRENLLLFEINPQQAGMPASSRASFYMDLRDRLAEVPGVRGVTHSTMALLSGANMTMGLKIPGEENARSLFLHTGPEFFETMQIPILQGRTLNARDRIETPWVAVVNEAFARTYFDGVSAIGKTFTSNIGPDPIEIVGVAGNALYSSLKDDMQPVVYLAAAQSTLPQAGMTYEVRTAGDPLALANTVRQIIQQIDARIAVTRVRTQASQIDQTINQEIVFARLCTGFALLALLIACVGLYGATAYNVARRTGEIGIRMALGARQGRVRRMIVQEAVLSCLLGVAIGVPAALAASRFLESFLFQLRPNDPLAVAGAVAVLLAAAVVAAYIPAHRASRIDPMVALRQE